MKNNALRWVKFDHPAAYKKVHDPSEWDDALSIALRGVALEAGALYVLSPTACEAFDPVKLDGSLPEMKGKCDLAEETMAEFILSYLGQDDSRVALFQTMKWEGDPCLDRTESPWVLLSRGSERRAVCLFQHRGNATFETVLTALLEKRDMTFIIVLSRLRAPAVTIIEKEELPQELVSQIVENVEFLAVDCFDGESYLLWGLPDAVRREAALSQ